VAYLWAVCETVESVTGHDEDPREQSRPVSARPAGPESAGAAAAQSMRLGDLEGERAAAGTGQLAACRAEGGGIGRPVSLDTPEKMARRAMAIPGRVAEVKLGGAET